MGADNLSGPQRQAPGLTFMEVMTGKSICHLSIVNYQLSIVNSQLIIVKLAIIDFSI